MTTGGVATPRRLRCSTVATTSSSTAAPDLDRQAQAPPGLGHLTRGERILRDQDQAAVAYAGDRRRRAQIPYRLGLRDIRIVLILLVRWPPPGVGRRAGPGPVAVASINSVAFSSSFQSGTVIRAKAARTIWASTGDLAHSVTHNSRSSSVDDSPKPAASANAQILAIAYAYLQSAAAQLPDDLHQERRQAAFGHFMARFSRARNSSLRCLSRAPR